MRKTVRFMAFFLSCALLFSSLAFPTFASNDEKFASYVNMGENAVKNNFVIPNLFRQDKVFTNMTRFPLVVNGGVEYVPISMFILYPQVEVSYSNTSDNFFIVNYRNDHYVSFNVSRGVASTQDGKILQLESRIFNRTRYIPARAVAEILGFVCETYDDTKNGVYCFRVSDGKSKKTINDLLLPFLEENLPESITPPDDRPEVQDDPIERIAARDVALTFTNFAYENTKDVLKRLESYGVTGCFAVTRNDILNTPQLVRDAYTLGHSLALTADFEGQTAEQCAESFIQNLNAANDALKFVLKKKTRLCVLPEGLPQEIAESEEFLSALSARGFVLVHSNTQTPDGNGYKGSAYNISSQIKNKVTGGFDENTAAVITSVLYLSDNTRYYMADLAAFINKYEQFSFAALDEAYALISKEN